MSSTPRLLVRPLRLLTGLSTLRSTRSIARSSVETSHNLRSYSRTTAKDEPQSGSRFWSKVTVKPVEKGFTITLDGSAVKTPSGLPLVVPHHKGEPLAQLIAQEWSVVTSVKTLKPHVVPLTSLAARALDLEAAKNPSAERATISEWLLPYLDTDTLLIISPEADCEGKLRQSQLREYHPVIQQAEKFWGVDKLSVLDSDVMVYGNVQPKEVQQAVARWIDGLDTWKLAALERATAAARSLIGGMLIVEDLAPVEQVAHLCNLEVEHQTALWGEVEDTHDVDHADLRRNLGAAYLVAN